jgi:hypothetical protein
VSYAKKSVDEKKKIRAALLGNGEKLKHRAFEAEEFSSGGCRKMANRRLALCSLANSAGQPTE